MPETPKPDDCQPPKAEHQPDPKPESGDADSWSRAQKERSYYYDDSHGYELYNPDEDDEEDEDFSLINSNSAKPPGTDAD